MKTRQWRLYDLLKKEPDKWFSQEEICSIISDYHYSDNETTHDKCFAIRKDKDIINESLECDKIVVCKNNHFKIATLEEYEEERNARIRKLKGQVKRIKDMDFKYSQHGQVKLLNNVLNELKETNEQWHETFVEEDDDE